MQTGLTWDNYIDECVHMRNIDKVISLNRSEVLGHKAIRNVTINDDKLKCWSKTWELHGFTRRKGLKSFGGIALENYTWDNTTYSKA